MRRRDLLITGMSAPLAMLPGAKLWGAPSPSVFNASSVAAQARQLAASAYRPPDQTLPRALAQIKYDQYRDYRFRPERALWADRDSRFQAQFFHRGFLHKDRVEIYQVIGDESMPVEYTPDLFTYGKAPRPRESDLGFAGFRLHTPLNSRQYFDELAVFLGASYFRAVAKGQSYGLSARGLAVKTGDSGPEEFPVFKAFWLERPEPEADHVVLHALLDGPSAAAAFRFDIQPGDETIFDVDMRLYPRVKVTRAGIAPLTSMFYFDAGDRVGIDDYRPAVHDSDGLAMLNGAGEQIWRPLTNPHALQMSSFQDARVRGFGLMQRKRDFDDYLDAEAHYQKRPSLWIQPQGDWGAGAVVLVEIPTADEYHDNIVAFWRPGQPLLPGREYRYRYRMHWCDTHVWQPELATIAATRIGAVPKFEESDKPDARLVVLELAGGRLARLSPDTPGLKPIVTANKGKIRNAVVYRKAEVGRWRMSFELIPGKEREIELMAHLRGAGGRLSETWLYRWNP